MVVGGGKTCEEEVMSFIVVIISTRRHNLVRDRKTGCSNSGVEEHHWKNATEC